jgi:hypothetical protein
VITPLLSYRIDAAYSVGKFLAIERRMNMKKLLILGATLVLLAGCQDAAKPVEPAKPTAPKPADLLTGRFGFYKMVVPAHTWSRDAQPYSLESQVNSDSTGKDGKSAVWRAGFASPLSRAIKPYSWSGTDAQDAPARGINNGSDGDYTPNNSNTQVFDPAFLKVDTDKIFETAQKHGGEKILTAAPDTPITYRASWDRNTSKLIWHVNYGEGKLVVEVDASSGDFIRVQK